ncbi:MAG: hypothetical protein COV32_03070 [Candidatus Yonathbacteria bacterium CG10_big_fil_rev_8_21_14_0_10_43_136]|uniref:Uncharacterized protein n=1 Tax=Candidatus Yonathbacteria bacterium CG_4_10_14_0_8_um_filter_43_17 TaxID=1975099 RepID=A0A2M7Q5R1_9BACT|nr:MAG: hypothetical protein COW60_03425 [Candidatus Yonathbacteria bacterium CG17_big_fil_post_rev_8_21_14_2_50_43_9]PIR40486.1 MAG: hypothetical protein COV32_03070 [Candidatus Yonathbacteria bacterium CG10_big_fil_rev_8_21_14_0_10_43_136]PIX56957.1 MAG: hypothetical protein COZ48_03260 [Candidatus Yonathbacteria bacterium CG_4_10_14_3_um_filter_43_12]PIY58723.1 MAG: hypothetical protein COY98_00540 [Candidatus Yonathbacteria bacterium CG_4_10_14_0_8_um_filter_43_17]PJC22403.1 MAG: hypothetic
MNIEIPPQMTPEQIAADEAEIQKIRERNLKARAEETAKQKIKESYDFSESQNLSSADQKSITREDIIARLARDQKAANDISEQIQKAA